MKIIQYVNKPIDNTGNVNNSIRTLEPNQLIDFDAEGGAYRIAFQALPGTQFKIIGDDDAILDMDVINPSLIGETGLIMGHTGIYELGFATPIIKGFMIYNIIDDKSIMILDALVRGTGATQSQSRALTAQDFDYYEEVYGSTNTSLAASLNAVWEGNGDNNE